MNYEINLPMDLNGDQLMDLLKETASRLKWKYKKSATTLSISQGSLNIEPTSFDVKIKTSRIIGIDVSINNIFS